jgi:hypothetical protein
MALAIASIPNDWLDAQAHHWADAQVFSSLSGMDHFPSIRTYASFPHAWNGAPISVMAVYVMVR